MERLLNSIFLIAGTAIGAGLIALPLTSVNLRMEIVVATVCFAVFYAYHSSMMTINLNRINQKPASIVDLSRNLSGSKTCLISMVSFCMLSFSLLTAYFSGVASTLGSCLGISNRIIVIGCSVIMFIILNLKYSLFSRLNSVLVTMLLIIIASFIIFVCTQHTTNITVGEINNLVLLQTASINFKEITLFLPIVLTSFGVQNICHQVYKDLNGDIKRIKIAFLIGVLIPAFLYTGWIFGVFENILTRDITFFEKLQQHQVSVGELIEFLCASSKSKYVEVFFKILSLLAIITSAIGIGLGLKKSIQETGISSQYGATAVVCVVPTAICLCFPTVFVYILTFGGMIATVFVIFVPYYLEAKMNQKVGFGHRMCLFFGILVVLCEIFNFAS